MSFWDALGSIVAGGATGLLGTAISKVFSFYENKQKFRQQVELMRLNADAARQEAEYRLKEAEVAGRIKLSQIEEEGRSKAEVSANEALAKSYFEASSRWSTGDSPWLVFVDVLRGVTRPVLTLMLCLIVFVMWAKTSDNTLESQIVQTVLYVTTAAVLWWFGSRPSTYNKQR